MTRMYTSPYQPLQCWGHLSQCPVYELSKRTSLATSFARLEVLSDTGFYNTGILIQRRKADTGHEAPVTR